MTAPAPRAAGPAWLAIETSTAVGAVAVGRDGRSAIEVRLAPPTRHAEELLPAIEYALRAAAVDRRELAGIAIGGGPGSFTGLRIAAATGKALVHALGIPLYAASGLLAQAASLDAGAAPVCALFDARRGEVYAACYRFSGADAPETLLEPSVGDAVDFVERLRPLGPIYVGDGAERNRARLEEAGAKLSLTRDAAPSASRLLELVAAHPARYHVGDPAAWQPDYVRASSAERGLSA